jgi:hypothetical protein
MWRKDMIQDIAKSMQSRPGFLERNCRLSAIAASMGLSKQFQIKCLLYLANYIMTDDSKEIEWDVFSKQHDLFVNSPTKEEMDHFFRISLEVEKKMVKKENWDSDKAIHSFLWQYSILTGEEVI